MKFYCALKDRSCKCALISKTGSKKTYPFFTKYQYLMKYKLQVTRTTMEGTFLQAKRVQPL